MKDRYKRRKIQACFFFPKIHPWKCRNKDLKFHPRSLKSEISGSLVKDCEHLFFDDRQSPALVWKWKVKVKVAQLCPTLCDPMDYTVHRILQARALEWVAFPFSKVAVATPGTVSWSLDLRLHGIFFLSTVQVCRRLSRHLLAMVTVAASRTAHIIC